MRVARRWPLVVFFVLISVALAAAYLSLRPPSYTAAARILVDHRVLQLPTQNSQFTTSSAGANWTAPLVLTQVEVLRSRRIATMAVEALRKSGEAPPLEAKSALREAAESLFVSTAGVLRSFGLGADWVDALRTDLLGSDVLIGPADRLLRRVSVRRVGETFVIEVLGSSETPNGAAAITNAVVSAYLQDLRDANVEAAQGASAWLRDIAEKTGTTARVIADAQPPPNHDGPRPLHVLVAALIGGLMAGLTIAVAAEAFDKRIRDPRQAAIVTGAECFGSLPAIRSLKSEFRAKRSLFMTVVERALGAAALGRSSATTLGVTALGKGEGVSTVSIALAVCAHRSGRRAVLVDLSGSMGAPSPAQTEASSSETIASPGNAQDPRTLLRKDGVFGLDVLPASALASDPAIWLAPLLSKLRDGYDVIILDLPPVSIATDFSAASESADALLLVIAAARRSADEFANGLLPRFGSARLMGSVLNTPRRRATVAMSGRPWALRGPATSTDIDRA